MQVTKAMLDKADKEHFNKEDMPSLDKLHSLSYVYHKERGHKGAEQFLTSAKVKAMVKKFQTKNIVRRKISKKRNMKVEKSIRRVADNIVEANKKSAQIGSAEWVKRETGGFA